jgi:hypothetical protein
MPVIAGAPTVSRPIEVSREQIGKHSWKVTYSDGSTTEDISWAGCKQVENVAKQQRLKGIRAWLTERKGSG